MEKALSFILPVRVGDKVTYVSGSKISPILSDPSDALPGVRMARLDDTISTTYDGYRAGRLESSSPLGSGKSVRERVGDIIPGVI